MKTAVIGTGKTGSKVVELLGDDLAGAFDESNPPTVDELKKAEAVIIFVPGDAVPEVLPMVLESKTPAAWGSTGYEWDNNLDTEVKKAGTRWIIASNFSLGMNIVRKCIQVISNGSQILPSPEFIIFIKKMPRAVQLCRGRNG